jgi:hypothetical protein
MSRNAGLRIESTVVVSYVRMGILGGESKLSSLDDRWREDDDEISMLS